MRIKASAAIVGDAPPIIMKTKNKLDGNIS